MLLQIIDSLISPFYFLFYFFKKSTHKLRIGLDWIGLNIQRDKGFYLKKQKASWGVEIEIAGERGESDRQGWRG